MTRTTRIVRNILAALLVLMGIVVLAGWWMVRRSLPKLDGSIPVAGLHDGVIVDATKCLNFPRSKGWRERCGRSSKGRKFFAAA
jgi:hypothetical protein